jgi:hypothetical protein
MIRILNRYIQLYEATAGRVQCNKTYFLVRDGKEKIEACN